MQVTVPKGKSMQKSDVVKAAEDITKVIMDGKQDDESVKTVLKDSQTHGGENLTPRTPWSRHAIILSRHAIIFLPSSSPATSPTKLTRPGSNHTLPSASAPHAGKDSGSATLFKELHEAASVRSKFLRLSQP